MRRSLGIEIVRRAYELWEQAGKPDGRDQEFYHHAEGGLLEANGRPIPEQPQECPFERLQAEISAVIIMQTRNCKKQLQKPSQHCDVNAAARASRGYTHVR